MLLDVGIAAVVLLLGNVFLRHFSPHMSWWQRLLKTFIILVLTALISYFFGRKGVLLEAGFALLPVLYVHGIWLPRHGVNGWTGEPREKYYVLRGWPPPDR